MCMAFFSNASSVCVWAMSWVNTKIEANLKQPIPDCFLSRFISTVSRRPSPVRQNINKAV